MFKVSNYTPPQTPPQSPAKPSSNAPQGLPIPFFSDVANPFPQPQLPSSSSESSSSLKRKREPNAARGVFRENPFPRASSSSSVASLSPKSSPRASSSSVASLSAMPPAFLSLSQFFSTAQEKQMERKAVPPSAPFKVRRTNSRDSYNGYTIEHFTAPSVIQTYRLIYLGGDGQYKTAWTVPADSSALVEGKDNSEILVLTFKENKRNFNIQKIYRHMENSIKQYREVLEKFGLDKCVTIYNAETAISDGYFIVEKIERSLEDVLRELTGKIRPFESKKQYESIKENLDENQQKAMSILKQIKEFYDLSIQHEIDTDIHVGNFRVKEVDGNYIIVLTDFREDLEKGDLIVNKRTELRDLKIALSGLFSEEFIDEYFAATVQSFATKESEKGLEEEEEGKDLEIAETSFLSDILND